MSARPGSDRPAVNSPCRERNQPVIDGRRDSDAGGTECAGVTSQIDVQSLNKNRRMIHVQELASKYRGPSTGWTSVSDSGTVF